MPRSSFALLALLLVALCSLASSANAVKTFTGANGCPTALAAKAPTNGGSFGPRAAPVAGVDYEY
ncbi:hypothetical protein JCM10449v2_002661 [Rhodotorula kratochvilovae]